MEYKLGNFDIKQADELPTRFSALIWGMAGDGKSTLAATAPGRKLWINFDPDGVQPISSLSNQFKNKEATILHLPIMVADLSAESSRVVDGFRRDDHLKLGAILGDPECKIDTVIVDSVTRFSQMALEHSIRNGVGGVNHSHLQLKLQV
jgi:hypothetical protein